MSWLAVTFTTQEINSFKPARDCFFLFFSLSITLCSDFYIRDWTSRQTLREDLRFLDINSLLVWTWRKKLRKLARNDINEIGQAFVSQIPVPSIINLDSHKIGIKREMKLMYEFIMEIIYGILLVKERRSDFWESYDISLGEERVKEEKDK